LIKFLVFLIKVSKKYKPKKIYFDHVLKYEYVKMANIIGETFNFDIIVPKKKKEDKPRATIIFLVVYLRKIIKYLSYKLFEVVLFPKRFFYNWINKKSRKNILFGSYKSIENVLEAWLLERNKKFNIQLYTTPRLFLTLKLIWEGAEYFQNPVIFRRIINKNSIKLIKEKWNKTKKDSRHLWMFNYKGFFFAEPIILILDKIIINEFEKVEYKITYLKNKIQRKNINCIVVPFDTPMYSKMIVSIGKSMNIPTMVIQHGVQSSMWNQDKKFADYIAVWSKGVKNMLLKCGIPKERIFITGNPYFDKFPKLRKRMEQKDKFGKKIKILVITFPSSPYNSEKYILTILDGIAKGNIIFNIVIKIHPSESLKYYKQLLSNYKNLGVKVVKRGNIIKYLLNSDIVISSSSTVTLEAFILEKPLICLNTIGKRYAPPLDGKSIPIVKNTDELVTRINNIFRNIEEENTMTCILNNHIGLLDGKSSVRIISLINELIK